MVPPAGGGSKAAAERTTWRGRTAEGALCIVAPTLDPALVEVIVFLPPSLPSIELVPVESVTQVDDAVFDTALQVARAQASGGAAGPPASTVSRAQFESIAFEFSGPRKPTRTIGRRKSLHPSAPSRSMTASSGLVSAAATAAALGPIRPPKPAPAAAVRPPAPSAAGATSGAAAGKVRKRGRKKRRTTDARTGNAITLGSLLPHAMYHGELRKLAYWTKKWNRRYIVLADACLYWFGSSDTRGVTRNSIPLIGYSIQSSPKSSQFSLVPHPSTKFSTYHLMADSVLQARLWVKLISYVARGQPVDMSNPPDDIAQLVRLGAALDSPYASDDGSVELYLPTSNADRSAATDDDDDDDPSVFSRDSSSVAGSPDSPPPAAAAASGVARLQAATSARHNSTAAALADARRSALVIREARGRRSSAPMGPTLAANARKAVDMEADLSSEVFVKREKATTKAFAKFTKCYVVLADAVLYIFTSADDMTPVSFFPVADAIIWPVSQEVQRAYSIGVQPITISSNAFGTLRRKSRMHNPAAKVHPWFFSLGDGFQYANWMTALAQASSRLPVLLYELPSAHSIAAFKAKHHAKDGKGSAGLSVYLLRKEASFEGWVFKKSKFKKVWKPRFMLLHERTFYYFASDDALKPLGSCYLPGYHVTSVPVTDAAFEAERYEFSVTHIDQKKYLLATDDLAARDEWLAALKSAAFVETDSKMLTREVLAAAGKLKHLDQSPVLPSAELPAISITLDDDSNLPSSAVDSSLSVADTTTTAATALPAATSASDSDSDASSSSSSSSCSSTSLPPPDAGSAASATAESSGSGSGSGSGSDAAAALPAELGGNGDTSFITDYANDKAYQEWLAGFLKRQQGGEYEYEYEYESEETDNVHGDDGADLDGASSGSTVVVSDDDDGDADDAAVSGAGSTQVDDVAVSVSDSDDDNAGGLSSGSTQVEDVVVPASDDDDDGSATPPLPSNNVAPTASWD
ncbi:hypothetical protein, variant [Thecamonas trahens ATCC 50062]|uniref:PH domain-containing protein n=1 Tax=Thecamonas trahens ATCC 50062 TaxID=461836 RepID=A0A0L0DHM3_THETB|nr:hypothetical protein, variant [Thecamonas trahens ATCC 50062]KNC51720.1 hypothetical protein, variant [Thecamonas trahens ATCC 50062]|eukprot:XP_013755850.1 hypothetical protein, variant [Thecamonas trahens ATCC 50062]